MLGGKRRKGSGSYPGLPGDIVTKGVLGECKYTNKKSISISREVIGKIEENALNAGKVPCLVFGFGEADEVVNNWVAFPLWALRKLGR